jgi:hypothetical protein
MNGQVSRRSARAIQASYLNPLAIQSFALPSEHPYAWKSHPISIPMVFHWILGSKFQKRNTLRKIQKSDGSMVDHWLSSGIIQV